MLHAFLHLTLGRKLNKQCRDRCFIPTNHILYEHDPLSVNEICVISLGAYPWSAPLLSAGTISSISLTPSQPPPVLPLEMCPRRLTHVHSSYTCSYMSPSSQCIRAVSHTLPWGRNLFFFSAQVSILCHACVDLCEASQSHSQLLEVKMPQRRIYVRQ